MYSDLWMNYTEHVGYLQQKATARTARPQDAARHSIRRSLSRLYTDRCAGYLPQTEPEALWDETVGRILSEQQTALIVPLFVWEEAAAAVPEPPPGAYPYQRESISTGSILILRDAAGRDRAVLRVAGMNVVTFAAMPEAAVTAEGICPNIDLWRSMKSRRYRRLLAARGQAFVPGLPLQIVCLSLLYSDG